MIPTTIKNIKGIMHFSSFLLPVLLLAGSALASPKYKSVYDSADWKRETNSAISAELNGSPKTSASAPIKTYGNKFFNSVTGEQFFIKGIAYQPSRIAGDEHFVNIDGARFIDPMVEPKICLRDLPYLVDLGVNTVRVYSIDPERDHTECFKAFEEAGIYVIADLSEPDSSIVRNSPVWDTAVYERYTKVVDSLNKYPNLLGFFAGNEVTNDKTNTGASPFVKSSIRDVKKHIKNQGYREIPVGYSTNDDAETRNNLADYFACGEDLVDFYGINMYEWCGYSTYYASGYKERTEEFKNYPVPVLFSEFGCNVKRPRPFTEVEALYSRLMTDVWSGGIAYMYFEEPNQYGVVTLRDGKVQQLDDFETLQAQFSAASPKGVTFDEYKNSTVLQKARTCPERTTLWQASTALPKEPDSKKCDCMERTLECRLSPYVKDAELKGIFDYACGFVDCKSITSDGVNGVYGYYADCNAKQKASYVINEIYKSKGSDKKVCDFEGKATLNSNVITTGELSKLFTKSGQTCAEVIEEHNLKEANSNQASRNYTENDISQSKSKKNKNDSKKYSNRASQISFYNNIFQAVGLSSLFLISLALIF